MDTASFELFIDPCRKTRISIELGLAIPTHSGGGVALSIEGLNEDNCCVCWVF